MEGNKKRLALSCDCRAVSDLIGQVLMIAVVVLAFSSISLALFSDEGAVKPPHTPRTDLQVDVDNGVVRVFHGGGEAIDLKYVKIILSAAGKQADFNMSDPAVQVFNSKGALMDPDDVFLLGDSIEVTPNSSEINLAAADASLYFVYTESSQVIHKAML